MDKKLEANVELVVVDGAGVGSLKVYEVYKEGRSSEWVAEGYGDYEYHEKTFGQLVGTIENDMCRLGNMSYWFVVQDN